MSPELVTVATWFLYYILYSVVGWIWEVVWCSLQTGRFQNRGFLFGPICPIYGWGAILCIYLTDKIQLPWYGNFLLITGVCTILEYIASVGMEKVFHARWWDYTNDMRWSLDGRIAVEPSIAFGLGGLAVIYVLQPSIEQILGALPVGWVVGMAGVLLLVYIIDTILSWRVSLQLREELSVAEVHVDMTAKIKERLRK